MICSTNYALMRIVTAKVYYYVKGRGIVNYRKLGRTNIDVSEIGLGTEYLNGQPRDTVVSVVHEAIDNGVNYIDLLFAFPGYRDNFSAAIRGKRDKLVIAGHLGSVEENGQYKKSTNKKESKIYFEDLLNRLNIDYVDVLMIHNVNSPRVKELEPGGLIDLALELQQQGKARYIGMSGHLVPSSLKAVTSGKIDVLMFPVNAEKDTADGKAELFGQCVERNVGLVAMKPFAGGQLLETGLKTGRATPVKCISYTLSQPGVSCLVAGVKDSEQLREALKYIDASAEERDFKSIIDSYAKSLKGNCVYCNHCLPCPSKIDIGLMNRILDKARLQVDPQLLDAYNASDSKASDCIQCQACMKRCPYEVNVIDRMKQLSKVFENT